LYGQVSSIPYPGEGEISDEDRIEIIDRLLEFKNVLLKKIPNLETGEEELLQQEIQSKDFTRIMKVRDTTEFARKYLVKHLQDQIKILESIKSGKQLCDFPLWKDYLLLITNANYVTWLDKAILAKYLDQNDIEAPEGQANQASLGKHCLFEVNSILECFLK